MTNYLPAIAVACLYFAASYLLFISLREPANLADGTRSGKRPALWIAGLAALAHAFIDFARSGFPEAVSLPFFTAFSVTLWFIVVIQLLMCIRHPADYLGLAIYPLAAIALLASVWSGSESQTLSAALQMHVLLSITAYAVLALAAAQAILVLVQRRFLNNHQPGGFMRALPPLTSTESLLFLLLRVGFVLLTLSLASGFVFLEDMFAQHLVHKTVLSCVAWLIFAVLQFGMWRFGWRGTRLVGWVLGGFAALLIAYFGSKLVLELILQR